MTGAVVWGWTSALGIGRSDARSGRQSRRQRKAPRTPTRLVVGSPVDAVAWPVAEFRRAPSFSAIAADACSGRINCQLVPVARPVPQSQFSGSGWQNQAPAVASASKRSCGWIWRGGIDNAARQEPRGWNPGLGEEQCVGADAASTGRLAESVEPRPVGSDDICRTRLPSRSWGRNRDT